MEGGMEGEGGKGERGRGREREGGNNLKASMEIHYLMSIVMFLEIFVSFIAPPVPCIDTQVCHVII